MENKLTQLFDYQKFENNPKLEGIIQETKKRYAQVLSDDNLYQVSAAGEAENTTETFDFRKDNNNG